MAARVPLYGTTAIYVALSNAGSNTSGAIARLLGWSINGVEFEEENFVEEVKGDQNGGDAGPPIEMVEHGDLHRIRMTLSKWDDDVLANIRQPILAGTFQTLGTVYPAGTLIFANLATFRLVLSQPNYTNGFCRSYSIVKFDREPKTMNMGSRASQLSMVATAYKDGNGLLYTAGSGALTSTLAYFPPI